MAMNNVLAIVVVLMVANVKAIKTTVRVENDLTVDTILTLHCKSSTKDLGAKVLHSGQYIEWFFQPNENTKYWCSVLWNNIQQKNIVIYDAAKDAEICTDKCWRGISPDRIYFYNQFKSTWENRYHWN
ncbi:S-protein homolog 29-like [Cicer arietinum]|uniref:S-protein homolog n=1 Tax=Cicer arietinum TaxID=3827 RepID=A0A1S2YQC0_CICAR|nr:S-protein homolog 5-like [Cicer arietinum]